jgi:hypothetical protein
MKRILVAMLGASLLAAGCADPVAPPTPVPLPATIPEPPMTGTLLVGGANTHQFMVTNIGALKVTLNNVTPSAAVGLGVGTPSQGSCLLLNNLTTVADPGVQLSGTATVSGTFCIEVFDVGNLVEPVTYTVSVLHS